MTPFTMTGLRLNMLEIAGTKGISDWAYRHFKPSSKRTVNFLLKEGILERNNTGDIVLSATGRKLYQQHFKNLVRSIK